MMIITSYSPLLLLALVGLAAAVPAAYEAREEPPCEPHIKCVDRINTCGVRFGGCYDTCQPSLAPLDPGCGSDEAAAATTTSSPAAATPTTTTITTVTPPLTTATPTICVDYINKCGQTYGGCFASTRPFPTFTGPSCSLETTAPPLVTTVAPPVTTAVPTICVDTINACSKTYGGCFASTSPFPTFTDPGCP